MSNSAEDFSTIQEPERSAASALTELALLDSVSDGVAAFDEQWRWVYLNRAAREMTRLAARELMGKVLWDLFPNVGDTRGVLERAMRERVPSRAEGYYEPLRLYYEVDAHPSGPGVILFIRDVSQKRASEQATRDLAAIVNSSRDAIIAEDSRGVVVSWNRGAEQMFGYSSEEAIGRHNSFVGLDTLPTGEPKGRYECAGSCKDGRVIEVSVSVSPVIGASGTIAGVSRIVRDVTQEKRFAQRLRESEDRLRNQYREMEMIYRTAPVGLAMLDREMRFLRLNERMAALNGLSVEGHLGRALGEVAPHAAAAMEPHIADALLRRRAKENVAVRFASLAHDGESRQYQVGVHPVMGQEGEVLGVSVVADDVTERLILEERLRRSEEQVQLVIDGIPGLACYITRELRYRFVNKRYCDWLGVSKEDTEGRPVEEILGDRYFQSVRELMGRALKGEEVHFERDFELDGQTRYVEVRYVPDASEAGNVRGFIAVISDITDRHRMDQALQASEEQYRFLANALPQLVWIADPTGKTVFLNDYWFGYTGAARDEGIAAWQRVVPEDDSERVRSAWGKALGAKAAFEFEFRLRRRADRDARWHMARVRPLLDDHGEIERWVGTAIDIHDRKLAEVALGEARADLSDILESITEAFIAVDWEWRFTYVNERVAEVLGIPREELIGRNIWEVSPESVNTAFYANYRRVMGERVAVHFETPYPPDRWFDVYAHPTARGMSAYVVDKTNEHKAEEALRRKAKLESLGLVAGGVAHDFNNLLVGILGAASLVKETLAEESLEMDMVRLITDSAERAAHLTRQMLDYAGKSRPVKSPVNLNTVVTDTVHLLHSSTPRTVHVTVEASPEVPPLAADPGQIQQIVLNLLTNANEAFPPGMEGSVHVRTSVVELSEGATVGMEVLAPGAYVVLEVEDTGFGMPAETRDRIFDPFFTTKFTGRGLGLAAVQGIVKSHHGAIDVRSAPGEGTRFRVYLQAVAPQPLQAAAEDERARTGAGGVLVVDDEPVVRSTCRAALEHYGYSVTTAESGQEGIRVFRENRASFVTIVVDLNMPDLSGFDVLRALGDDLRGANVIVSSGHSELEFKDELGSFPAAKFIQKPYRMNELRKLLRH